MCVCVVDTMAIVVSVSSVDNRKTIVAFLGEANNIEIAKQEIELT